ncbi:MAG: hypothetical protein ACJ75F_03485, partial [Flavisolibacter sp.]
ASGPSTIEGYTTDAKNFTVSTTGAGLIQTVYFEGSHFSTNAISVQSEEPLTIAMAFLHTGMNVEAQGDKSSDIIFSSAEKPKSVLLDGKVLHQWQYDPVKKTMSLKFTQGRHELAIQYDETASVMK